MLAEYSWMKKQLKQQPIQSLAGYPLELNAKEYFEELSDEQEVTWNVARRTYLGQVLRWIPRSPGIYTITLRVSGAGSRTITAQVGLRQQDLADRKDELDYFFCLVVPSGMKLHFIPLLNHEGETPSGEKLKREIEEHNPAFAQLMRFHTQIYRQKVSRLIPQLWYVAKKVEPGLYAVFSGNMVYLGSATPIRKAVEVVRTMLEEQVNRTTGRGLLLIEIEKVVNELKPLEYRYSEEAEFPPLTRPGFGAFAVENFGRSSLNYIVASLLHFGNTIGVHVGLGGATSVITYNAASGLLSTRIFDSTLGLSRQISSGFDIFYKRDNGIKGFDGKTGLLGTDSFGRGTREGINGALGGLAKSKGAGPLGSGRGQVAMDGYEENGIVWQDAPGGQFGYNEKNGDIPDKPSFYAPYESGKLESGTVNYMQPIQVWGTLEDDPDAGAPSNDPDAGSPPGDYPEPDTNAPDAGEDGDPPEDVEGGATHPVNPNDPGNSVDTLDFTPIPGYRFGRLGVITRGAGYTDPNPDDTGGATPTGGEVHILPGGGYTDFLPDGVSPEFSDWGAYNPPIGGEIDPVFDPVPMMHMADGAMSISRASLNPNGIHMEVFSGKTGLNQSVDGLFSAGMFERGPEIPVGGSGKTLDGDRPRSNG